MLIHRQVELHEVRVEEAGAERLIATVALVGGMTGLILVKLLRIIMSFLEQVVSFRMPSTQHRCVGVTVLGLCRVETLVSMDPDNSKATTPGILLKAKGVVLVPDNLISAEPLPRLQKFMEGLRRGLCRHPQRQVPTRANLVMQPTLEYNHLLRKPETLLSALDSRTLSSICSNPSVLTLPRSFNLTAAHRRRCLEATLILGKVQPSTSPRLKT